MRIVRLESVCPAGPGAGLVLLMACSLWSGCGDAARSGPAPIVNAAAGGSGVTVTPTTLGATKPLFQVGNCYLAGQPQAEDFAAFKAAGIKQVISIRDPGEIAWDEKAAAEAAGLEFVQIPCGSPNQLTEETLQAVCRLLRQADQRQDAVVLHCGAAVRAAAVWMAYHCTEAEGTWEESEGLVAQMVRVPDAWKVPVKKYVQETAVRN